MGCGCENDTYKIGEAEVNSEGNKVLIIYQHPNIGKRVVNGPITLTRYGYYGPGAIFEAFKDDIRARPGNFGVCANCQQPLTITKNDVFCPRCSQIESAIINRPTVSEVGAAIKSIEPEPEKLPEPYKIQPAGTDIDEDTLQAMIKSQEEIVVTLLESIDWGRNINKRHLALLEAEGITTLEAAKEAGPERLIAIKGIGEKIVDTIMARA